MIALTADISPPEIQRLLNPAYCACILARYAHSYRLAHSSVSVPGVPYPLLFLCLPLALHSETRAEVRGHTKTYGLHRLIREKPGLLISIAERVNGFTNITRAALLFGLKHDSLDFDTQAVAVIGKDKFVRKITKSSLGEEAFQPIQAAELIGAWFAQLTVAEVFLHLGIRPH